MTRVSLIVEFLDPDEGGRQSVPDLSSGLYRPHLLVGEPSRRGDLTEDEAISGHMLGVRFIDGPVGAQLGRKLSCIAELVYPGVDYGALQPGVGILVAEGRRIVATGRVA